MSKSPISFEAVPPFSVGKHGWVYDATGSKVIVCNDPVSLH